MSNRKFVILMSLVFIVAVLSWRIDPVWAQSGNGKGNTLDTLLKAKGKVTPTQRKAAATNAAALGQSTLSATSLSTDPATGAMIPDYFGSPNWAFSPPLTKFVDKLAGLGSAGANALGQYIPVAVPDTTTYPRSDYYEIAVVEFNEKLHSDLPPTRHRGYV